MSPHCPPCACGVSLSCALCAVPVCIMCVCVVALPVAVGPPAALGVCVTHRHLLVFTQLAGAPRPSLVLLFQGWGCVMGPSGSCVLLLCGVGACLLPGASTLGRVMLSFMTTCGCAGVNWVALVSRNLVGKDTALTATPGTLQCNAADLADSCVVFHSLPDAFLDTPHLCGGTESGRVSDIAPAVVGLNQRQASTPTGSNLLVGNHTQTAYCFDSPTTLPHDSTRN